MYSRCLINSLLSLLGAVCGSSLIVGVKKSSTLAGQQSPAPSTLQGRRWGVTSLAAPSFTEITARDGRTGESHEVEGHTVLGERWHRCWRVLFGVIH